MLKRISIVLILGLCFCGEVPQVLEQRLEGTVDIRVYAKGQVNNTKGSSARGREYGTTWSYFVVEIKGADMETVIDTIPRVGSENFQSFFVSKVHKGTGRTVTLWTIDEEGVIIHGKESTTIDIVAEQSSVATFELTPIRGSILIELASIPTNIDSIIATFTTVDTVWEERIRRESKSTLSLDKIPFGKSGTISIVGVSVTGDTITSWSLEGHEFKDELVTIEASFVTVGKVHMKITIRQPGLTLIYGLMDTLSSLGDERGGILITEIMFATTHHDYIEIYNPSITPFEDSIILQRDGDREEVLWVSVPPKGFFVIGKSNDDWVDKTVGSSTLLQLPSTDGWVVLFSAKDRMVLDAVVYHKGTSFPEWPNSSGEVSIALDTLREDPEYNNFGRRWESSETVIADTVQFLGSPGRF